MIKRLRRVTWVHENSYVNFIKERGLLVQYLSENNYMDFEKEEAGCNDGWSAICDVDDHGFKQIFARNEFERGYRHGAVSCEKITIDGKEFYLTKEQRSMHKYGYMVYTELSLIIDDKNFKWKENTKYNSKEAMLIRNNFEYLCIANADGNGKVIVRYIKCENYHRNKVTIAELDVENVCNEKFLEVIDKWTKEFKESIAA